MEIYENEHDQVDAVKRFFAENGKALAVGIILGVGALVGWRYWTSHQTESARSASLAYQNTVTAVSAGKPDSIPAAEKFAAENKIPMARWLHWNWRSSLLTKMNLRKPQANCNKAWLRPAMKISKQ